MSTKARTRETRIRLRSPTRYGGLSGGKSMQNTRLIETRYNIRLLDIDKKNLSGARSHMKTANPTGKHNPAKYHPLRT